MAHPYIWAARDSPRNGHAPIPPVVSRCGDGPLRLDANIYCLDQQRPARVTRPAARTPHRPPVGLNRSAGRGERPRTAEAGPPLFRYGRRPTRVEGLSGDHSAQPPTTRRAGSLPDDLERALGFARERRPLVLDEAAKSQQSTQGVEGLRLVNRACHAMRAVVTPVVQQVEERVKSRRSGLGDLSE